MGREGILFLKKDIYGMAVDQKGKKEN